jgi:hypothetical protein
MRRENVAVFTSKQERKAVLKNEPSGSSTHSGRGVRLLWFRVFSMEGIRKEICTAGGAMKSGGSITYRKYGSISPNQHQGIEKS